jgi:lysophospholipase L1-like esterase
VNRPAFSKSFACGVLRAFVALAFALAGATAQTVRYEFTGGSMTPTLAGLPAGVTASDFSIGTYTFAALSDNGGNGNSLRLSRGDVGTTSTSAFAGPVLSFTLSIPAGVTLNLSSLSLDFTSGGITGAEYINARVFSSIDGFDNLTADTIGTLGRVANGTDSGTMTLSLSTPDSNPTNGANSNNGDFDSLTHRSITFHLPFIRDSQTTPTDYVDIDNLTLAFTTGAPGVSNFTAKAISAFETTLSWDESLSDESTFLIERSVTGTGLWESIISTGPNVTSIRDLTAPSGAGCTYRIRAALGAGGFSPSVTSSSVAIPAVSTAPLQIMPMGDSITQGAGAGGGYRSPLFASLSAAGFQMQFIGARGDNATTLLTTNNQTRHEGHGSYSTDLLLGNLDASTPYGGTNEGGYWITGIPGTRPPAYPDLILLMIGTNDIGMWAHTPAQTIAYYDQLLTKLVTLRPAARIICASIVPFVLSEFEEAYPDKIGVYTHREPNNVIFNSLLPGLVATHQAAGHRVQFYDMRQMVNPANAATLIGGDGVHPNQAGYNAIASGWFDALKRLPLVDAWRLLHFNTATGHAADLADPDGDGASNLVEFAFGTDPKSADNSPLHGSTVVDSGVSYLGVTFPRRKHADLRYVVEVSEDLVSWAPDTLQSGSPSDIDADFEQVTFRDRQPVTANRSRFIRVSTLKP